MPDDTQQRFRLTSEEWRDFSETYLQFFESMPRDQAYAQAVREMRKAGKRYPSQRSLKRRLYGIQETPAQEQETPEQETPEPVQSELSGLQEENEMLKTVLRLYRFCRERDRDAVCDLLLPDLAREDE